MFFYSLRLFSLRLLSSKKGAQHCCKCIIDITSYRCSIVNCPLCEDDPRTVYNATPVPDQTFGGIKFGPCITKFGRLYCLNNRPNVNIRNKLNPRLKELLCIFKSLMAQVIFLLVFYWNHADFWNNFFLVKITCMVKTSNIRPTCSLQVKPRRYWYAASMTVLTARFVQNMLKVRKFHTAERWLLYWVNCSVWAFWFQVIVAHS